MIDLLIELWWWGQSRCGVYVAVCLCTTIYGVEVAAILRWLHGLDED